MLQLTHIINFISQKITGGRLLKLDSMFTAYLDNIIEPVQNFTNNYNKT